MHTETLVAPQPGQPPAYLANGLVGLRVPPIPLPGGTALVGAWVGLSPEKALEEYAPAPYPVGADIAIGGTWLSAAPHLARFVSQEMDFAAGELRSHFTYAVGEVAAEVRVSTWCSRASPTLAVQEIAVTVSAACELGLQAHLDPRGLPGRLLHRWMPARHQDGILLWESRGGLATLGAAYLSQYVGEDLVRRRRNDYCHEEDLQLTQYTVAAQPGKEYRLWQVGSLVPGALNREPHWEAGRLAGYATWLGRDALRAAHRAAWADLWLACPRIAGDPVWQQRLEAAFYYLHASVGPASPMSVAPFGLSQRSAYSGHVFWDTECFMMPSLWVAAPDTAKALVEYRARLLEAARANARLNGYRGAQYPWQSSLHGNEVTPWYSGASGGLGEQHVNLDVAWAAAQYVHATGDRLAEALHAWPILHEVAEWVVSRAVRTARGWEIRHITGPDEGRDNVHNDAFTNGMAIVVLREAATMARRLGHTPPDAWEDVAAGLFLPIHPPTRVLVKNDSFVDGGGILAPETMMLQFPIGLPLPADVAAATRELQLSLAHQYLGMPMNSVNFAVWAARAGRREMAAEFLQAGTASRLMAPYDQIRESAKCEFSGAVTVFVTAAGALVTGATLGFTGLQVGPDEPAAWARHPAGLPAGWEEVSIPRLWLRGRPASLTARHGARAELRF